MKAKDLIKKLQELDPEQEISAVDCIYCQGSDSLNIELSASVVYGNYNQETFQYEQIETIGIRGA